MTAKEKVLALDPHAQHSLGQYAYIKGFEDCSDEIITFGRKLAQDCNGEEEAWSTALRLLESEKATCPAPEAKPKEEANGT